MDKTTEPHVGPVIKTIQGKKMPGQAEADLRQEHPDFTRMKPIYRKARIFSMGGAAVEGREEFLKQHVYESKKQYEIRLWLAKYRNHARPVVNVFQSAVWENTPDRQEFDALFGPYVANVDRQGTSANDFFNAASLNAAKVGVHFVLVDYQAASGAAIPINKKDADKQELRPYFAHINAEDLIDWGTEIDSVTGVESISYIVYRKNVEVSARPFKGHSFEDHYFLWTKDSWEEWKEDGKMAKLVDEGEHKCKEVPVVPFYFEPDEPMTGISSINDIVGLCERIYRNGSCLDKSLYDTAFPLQLFLGFNAEDIAAFTRASSTGLISDNVEADSKYIEPAGRSFEELRMSIASDENAIKELALRIIRPESKVAESAESKKMDQQQLNSKLSEFAGNIEEGERRCWQLVGKWLGRDGIKADVKYSKTFDDNNISVELIKVFADLAREQVIPNEDIVDLIMRSGFLPDTYDKKEAIEKIKDQNRIDTNFPGVIVETNES